MFTLVKINKNKETFINKNLFPASVLTQVSRSIAARQGSIIKKYYYKNNQ
jgi:hypothetical protein